MLKELLKYYIKSPKFKYLFLYIFLCLFIYPLENIGLSKLNSKIYPLLGNSESNKLLVYLIILFVTIYSFKIIKDYVKINVNPYMVESIRKSYFENILNKYKKNFEYTKNGTLLNQLIVYPDILKNILYELFNYIIPELFGLVVSLGFIYKHDHNILKYVGIICIPLVIIYINRGYLTRIHSEHLKYRDIQINLFSDNISNLFQIYITDSINKSINNTYTFHKKFIKVYKKYIIYDSFIIISYKILYLVCIILVINYIKKAFINKDYSYEKVILVLSISMLTIKNIVNIGITTYDAFKHYGALGDNINNLLNKNIDGTKQIDINMIQFNNITFKYPKTQSNILENMNLDIKLGDKVVIFGKSGSGKSTIFKLLMGFFSPTNSKILVNDSNINDLDLTYYRNQFAYVGQDTKLFDMSVLDNIKYSLTVTNEEVYALISKYKITTVYEKLEKGLETNAGTDGNNLSGGQKQMVLILRALLKKPKIYLFDEPTAALDPNTGKIIYTILRDINETTLVISHDINIKDYFPIVYNLEDKRLVKEK